MMAGLHAIVSPNACALFSLDEEYTANMNMMQFVNQKSNLSGEGSIFAPVKVFP